MFVRYHVALLAAAVLAAGCTGGRDGGSGPTAGGSPAAHDPTAGQSPATHGQAAAAAPAGGPQTGAAPMARIEKTDEQWKSELTPEQYFVTRQCGTEPPFSGQYWNEHRKGEYVCVACGQVLFSSETKFDSGTGWPSYWAPQDKAHVTLVEDRSLGMVRTEARCSRCGAHLGHLFDDGPAPTGQRYCINSAALKFVEQGK